METRAVEAGIPEVGCWINGKERHADDRLPVMDPARREVIATVPRCDASVVDEAVAGAVEAQKDWARIPAGERRDRILSLADQVEAHGRALALRLSEEVGKPIRAAEGEVANAVQLIRYFAEEAFRLTGHLPLTGTPGRQTLVVREPVGVVAAITPFNYPLSTLICKSVPALAVGCAVVAKPDEHTPLTTLELARLATEAGLPPGLFQVVTGLGPETGDLLVRHPDVRLITFTGSTEVGKTIQQTAAAHVKRLILELGGHCPAVVCADADWRSLVPALVAQAYKNSGQYCYRVTRLLVAEEIREPFLDAFVSEASRLTLGDPKNPETDLGPLNNRSIFERVSEQVLDAVALGAQTILGGVPPDPDAGFFFPPTVLTRVRPEMCLYREEIFGPVVLALPFQDEDEGVERANDTPFGLAAYVFSKDLGKALRLASRIEAGSVWVNGIHQAQAEAPFGGMKESGIGREKSRFGVEAFTELKTYYISY